MRPLAPPWVEWLLGVTTWMLAPVVAIGISVVYLRAPQVAHTLLRRMLASLHGLIIAFANFAALLVAFTGHSDTRLGLAFSLLLCLALASMIVAIPTFGLTNRMNLLLIPLLACLLWVYVMGGMAVTGNWL